MTKQDQLSEQLVIVAVLLTIPCGKLVFKANKRNTPILGASSSRTQTKLHIPHCFVCTFRERIFLSLVVPGHAVPQAVSFQLV